MPSVDEQKTQSSITPHSPESSSVNQNKEAGKGKEASGLTSPNPTSPVDGRSGVSAKTNRKGFLEVNGEVLETLPNATFRVALENGHELRVYLGGKMRMHRIMLIPGDRVKVEISPYDLSKGRVVYRY